MEQRREGFKWYWFLAPEVLVAVGVSLAGVFSFVAGDIGMVLRLCLMWGFFFAALCVNLLFSVFHINPPPHYFRLLWILWFAVMVIVQLLFIGEAH